MSESEQVQKRIDDVKFFVGMVEDEYLAGNEGEAFNWAEGLDSAASSLRSELEPPPPTPRNQGATDV